MIDFILGGARSGKSKLAETRAQQSGKTVVYVATAENHDGEMSDRITHHKESRPQHWQTVEEPLHLDQILKQHDREQHIILVDCLTLWVSNLLMQDQQGFVEKKKQEFFYQLKAMKYSDVIFVSNETGLGVVPMGQLSRRFVDESGWLHQELAQLAHRVTLVVAGLPHILKQ